MVTAASRLPRVKREDGQYRVDYSDTSSCRKCPSCAKAANLEISSAAFDMAAMPAEFHELTTDFIDGYCLVT